VSNWLSSSYYWLIPEFLLAHFGFLLGLVLLAVLLQQRRSPSSTIAWLLVILLAPYVGVPLYIFFGGRKVRRMARRKEPIYHRSDSKRGGDHGGAVERLLASYGVPPPTTGNRLELVASGEEAYERVVELINEARATIHITTYILGRDPGSRALIECLTRRAADGVAVRLLIDNVGSWRVGRRFLAPLTAAGAQVAFFMGVLHFFRGRANLRNHRKLVVVDGRAALTGGMNLAWPYIGPPNTAGLWRDMSVVLEGPAVSDLEALFASDWRFATGADPEAPARLGHDAPKNGREASGVCQSGALPPAAGFDSSVLQVVASGPDVAGDPLYESLLALIFSAQNRIWIVTPYYVPDEMLARALGLAARRGVDVRLILPARSNHLSADLARASYLRDLHNAGGRVLLYTPIMLHAKAVVFDDQLAVIGSANMDMRSLFLNYEVALFVSSLTQVEEVAAWAGGLMANCERDLPSPGWPRELAENVVRLLSPLL
jgi:cardiolipin synthase A/B